MTEYQELDLTDNFDYKYIINYNKYKYNFNLEIKNTLII